ncbi:hypothetical protein JCM10049v2_005878 [Rhodotorula toruloides]
MPSFGFNLDTPSKYLGSGSPNPWSFGTGLTPSLFSSLNSRGFTPSITESHDEPNPFELTLSGPSSKRHSVASGMLGGAKDGDAEIDFGGSSLASTLMGGRKRAMSSPAIGTPGGTNSFFAMHQPSQLAPGAFADLAIKPSKRPRIDSTTSSGIESSDRIFSSNDRDSDESPASSVVLSPPEIKSMLPSIREDKTPLSTPADIPVSMGLNVAGSSNIGIGPPTTASLLSQLEKQRSAMIAAGTAYSQSNPLPIKPLDIAVKSEAIDDFDVRPPVTRGQSKSKKGKAPVASGSTTAAMSEDGTPAPAPKRKGGRKKSAAAAAKTAAEKKEGQEPAEDDDEDSVKRKQFLERNRIAACKSRQKKKEKTRQLEQFAAELCNRNHVLQQTALALRNEAVALRQLMQAHNGCSCEHAQGYIARDAAGGGIATIDQLAGHTLHLDYTAPPAMGTEDDCYSFLDRGEPPPGPNFQTSKGAYAAPTNAGPAIPVVSKPGPSPKQSPVRQSSTRSNGMSTRRSGVVATVAPEATNDVLAADVDVAALQASSYLGMGIPPTAEAAAQAGFVDDAALQRMRANSAPPTTPGWDGAAPDGDYFNPKTRPSRVVVA